MMLPRDCVWKSQGPEVDISDPLAAGKLSVIPLADVEKHNKEGDAWVVIHGKVYDISTFMHKHPGGKGVFKQYLGKVRSLWVACSAISLWWRLDVEGRGGDQTGWL